MGNIIAVANIAKLQALQFFLLFLDGHIIGQRLTGVGIIAEAIDHRDRGVLRQVQNDLMSKGPDHNSFHHSLQVLRHIINRFTLSEADLRGG